MSGDNTSSQPEVEGIAFSSSGSQNTPQDMMRLALESAWDVYVSWSTEYCQETLNNLGSAVHKKPGKLSSVDSRRQNPMQPSDISSQSFEIIDFDDSDGLPVSTIYVSAVHETVVSHSDSNVLGPYSIYDSCTPTSRNLMRGDDPDYLPFIPFSDDPTYDFEYDNSHHKYFAWQKDSLLDTDSENFLHKTLHQFVSYGQPFDQIDSAGIFPLKAEEIAKFSWKRDFPLDLMPASAPRHPYIPTEMTPKETVTFFLERFCNNLNCVTSFCPTHLGTRTPRPQITTKDLDPSKITEGLQLPCGANCFVHPLSVANGDSLAGMIWTTSDTEMLSVTLEYAPEALSCDLAVICRKPCREVHRHRLQLAAPNPDPVFPPVKPKLLRQEVREFDMMDPQRRRFATRLPCDHEGPCGPATKCACFLTHAPCFSRCRCVTANAPGNGNMKMCPRRWKGCTCARAAKVCGTRKCSCYRAFIECDPDVCLSCEAKDASSHLCRNVGIQRGNFKVTEVRQSKWGLGLFIAEPCQKHDLISEYVGELIYNPTVRSRAGISTHKGRSYIFDLNRRVSIDAMSAGNGTRYINHSSEANCDTSVFLVNGEHRIGIFAARQLQEGEELFIDYGPKFFETETDVNDVI